MRISLPLTLTVLCAGAVAQTVVEQNGAPRAAATAIAGSDVGAPSLRYWAGHTTDGANMFVFGGRSVDTFGNAGSLYFNGLHAYDPNSNSWTELSADGAAGAPSNRWRVATCFDPNSNRIVCFGGRDASTVFDETWVFDLVGNTWSSIPNPTPGTTGPTARFDAQMCYDATTGSLILFGGQGAGGSTDRYGDTWLLAGTTWVPMAPTTSPSDRSLFAMTSRTAPYNDIVLVGGRDVANVRLNETWRWDGASTSWQLITANNGTVPVTFGGGNAAVYDSVRQVVSIINGTGTGVAPSNTTGSGSWTSEYDCVNNVWRAFGNDLSTQSVDDPVVGRLQRFAVEFLNGKTYFWAGQNPGVAGDADLALVKEYQASPVAAATSYGSSCSGPGGALTLTANNLPWTGRTFEASCGNLGVGSLALSVWGSTQTSTPLGAVLPQAGAGCLLLNDASSLLDPQLVTTGSITTQVTIPNNALLAGQALQLQTAELVFNASSQWTGLFTSNGLQVTFGAL